MKGYIRIGGALVFSITVIVGALYLRGNVPEAKGGIVVSVAPERQYIEYRDANGNGIPDWKENLTANLFDAIDTPTSTSQRNEGEEYVSPKTFTGKFSEAFFQDYIQGKVETGDSLDSGTLVSRAVASVKNNTGSKRYSRLEIRVVPDSPEAIRAYGNRIVEIIKTYTVISQNETVILMRALESNNPAILNELKPIRMAYEKFISETLLVSVPEGFVRYHLDLLNVYEAILMDIKAMQVAFDDPLLSLARVDKYTGDTEWLRNAFKNIGITISKYGVSYANDEPGAFFYLFDI